MQFLRKGLSLVSMKDCLMLLLVLGIFWQLFALHKYALCLFISLQVLNGIDRDYSLEAGLPVV